MRSTFRICAAGLLAAATTIQPGSAWGDNENNDTAYPISHVVVIFQENVSFDHYFATYPFAQNLPGEPAFHAKKGTPSVNGLNEALLTKNPNSLQPQRIDRSHVNTADQDHDYQAEQQAFDHGLMDKFVEFTGTPEGGGPSRVMDYFDGNTVTAFWNYAQHFAMNDNSFGTTFGPSAPGALNLTSGQTGGVIATGNGNPVVAGAVPDDEVTGTTVTGDPQPYGDACSTRDQARLGGTNI